MNSALSKGIARSSGQTVIAPSFSYLMMALEASFCERAVYLSSSRLKDWTSTDGSRVTSYKHAIDIVGLAAAG